MRAEVINTGSELLLGLVTNTHLGFLAAELRPLGIRVERQLTVPDGPAIREALEDTLSRPGVVLVTGGLGPTTDDITRETAAGLLGLPLRIDETVLGAIRARFARRNFPWTERNARQAMVPAGAVVLPNPHGTAPGLYFPPGLLRDRKASHLFLLPGPPRELHPMVRNHVLPVLQAAMPADEGATRHTYRLTGLGESMVEELIGAALEARGDLEVGYCARPSEVDFRLIGPARVLAEVEPQVLAAVGHFVYSRGEDLEEVLVRTLAARDLTVATAESCTGGLLADRLTAVPGASAVFPGGFVTYADRMKIMALGVPEALLSQHGAVSAPVAKAMAEGARQATGADYALATTGIAGPSGGTPEKPVGTVFLALARDGGETLVRHCFHPASRSVFKHITANAAFDLLRRVLGGLPPWE